MAAGELLTMPLEINSQDTVVDSIRDTVLSFQVYPSWIGTDFRTQFGDRRRMKSGGEEANLTKVRRNEDQRRSKKKLTWSRSIPFP